MGTFLIVAAIIAAIAIPDEDTFVSAVLSLTGASEIEELDGEVVESFRHLAGHPLLINVDSRSRLLSSGLFSSYQLASILDYRARDGDILSVTELSMLDGFSPSFAEALAPFVSFVSKASLGQSSFAKSFYADADAKASFKKKFSYGARLRTSTSSRVFLNAGYSGKDRHCLSLYLCGKHRLDGIVAGNFNARFGQGLAMWSGMSFAGVPSSGNFARNPTMLSASSSFTGTGTLHGIGGQWRFGRLSASIFAAEEASGANFTLYGKKYQVGSSIVSDYSTSFLSLDFRTVLGKFDIFSEFVSCGAFLAGTRMNIAYGHSLSLALRSYPVGYNNAFASSIRSSTKCRDERAVSAGWVLSKGKSKMNLTADCIRKLSDNTSSFKLVSSYSFQLSECFSLSSKLSLKLRSGRKDFRIDGVYDSQRLRLSSRANVLHCRGTSFLAYVEPGVKLEPFQAFLSLGWFRVDNWDDRIYAWQRDAPLNFSVPAYYGRGAWLSAFARLMVCDRFKLYLKAAATKYLPTQPETVSERKDSFEIKLQLSISLGS